MSGDMVVTGRVFYSSERTTTVVYSNMLANVSLKGLTTPSAVPGCLSPHEVLMSSVRF